MIKILGTHGRHDSRSTNNLLFFSFISTKNIKWIYNVHLQNLPTGRGNELFSRKNFPQKMWSFFDLLQNENSQTHEKIDFCFFKTKRHQCPMTLNNDRMRVDKDNMTTLDFRYSAELSRPWLLGMGTIPGWLGSRKIKSYKPQDRTNNECYPKTQPQWQKR